MVRFNEPLNDKYPNSILKQLILLDILRLSSHLKNQKIIN